MNSGIQEFKVKPTNETEVIKRKTGAQSTINLI